VGGADPTQNVAARDSSAINFKKFSAGNAEERLPAVDANISLITLIVVERYVWRVNV
jgi:hypothetical protein